MKFWIPKLVGFLMHTYKTEITTFVAMVFPEPGLTAWCAFNKITIVVAIDVHLIDLQLSR